MRLFAAKKVFWGVVFALLILTASYAVWGYSSAAYADTTTNTVTFYPDENTEPFAIVEIINGTFTVPEAQPVKEGFIFKNWSDGFASYIPGNTYTVSGSLKLIALWEDEVKVEEYRSPPLFNTAEKTALYISIGVLALIFLFCFYWFGIKDRGLKELGAAIRKLFTRNK